jgi:hypothetical protein
VFLDRRQDTDEEALPDVDRKPVSRPREYDKQSVFRCDE